NAGRAPGLKTTRGTPSGVLISRVHRVVFPMSAAGKWEFVTVEEYLAGELLSPIKHEYRDGIVYAMAGARNVHNDIAVNALAAIHSQLRGHPCKPCNSDT